MTPEFFSMMTLVIFIIGLAKGGLGGSLAVLATPLMSLVMPADQVIGLLLPILMAADCLAIISHWGHWDSRLVMLLVPGSALGVIGGSFLIASISPPTLRRLIGLIVLLFVLYKLFERRIQPLIRYQNRSWHGIVAGAISGLSSTLAHTGGPPAVMYLLMQNLSPRTFVATMALSFTLINWLKVPSYIYLDLFDFDRLWTVLWLLPLLPIGVWLGKIVSERLDKHIFEAIITGLLALTALFLLI